jgi:hypothetical protein
MSGGPAFALRDLSFEFVGIIQKHAEGTDDIYFAHAGLIGSDGLINLPFPTSPGNYEAQF